MKLHPIYATLLFVTVNLFGQNDQLKLDEVTVTDSRFERPASKKSRSTSLLTAKDIDPYLGSTLAALLNDQVGIHINGSNSHDGAALSYFIRGGNNRQVLFLIDGIPVNDPTQIENDFDLRTIDLSAIESIEIIRGAASSLYGSAAASAVIKITTKRPSQQGFDGSIRTIFGTNNTQQKFRFSPNNQSLQLQLSMGSANHSTSMNLSDHRTMGMSSIVGDENDPTKKQNLGFRYHLQLLPQFSIHTFFKKDFFSSHYDDSFPSLMDANNIFTSESQRFMIQPKWTGNFSSFKGRLSRSSISRDFESAYPMSFSGDVTDIEGVFSTNFSPNFKALIGINHNKQEAKFDKVVQMNFMDSFMNLLYDSKKRFELQAGVRLSEHSTYGSNWTYHVNPSIHYKFSAVNLRLYSTLSTAFIAPSLYKLFDSYAGNEELNPELNQSFEIGSSLSFANDGQIQLVYFKRDHENFIAYDLNTFRYVNDARDFHVYGAEFLVEYPLSERLRLHANYTYTQHEEGEGLRIPKHKGNANFRYKLRSRMQLLTNFQFVGERDDQVGQDVVVLSSYWLCDLRLTHQFPQTGLSLFTAFENLFNVHYEEVRGYTTRGRNFSVGLSYAF